MESWKKLLDTFLKVKELAVVLAAIFLWILNIWFVSKLSPFAESLNDLTIRVNATENSVNSLMDVKYDVYEIKSDVSYIRGMLDATK